MKNLLSFIGHTFLDILEMFFIPLFLLALFGAGFSLAHFADMRPPNTPHYHFRIPFLFKFDWTAPDSSYAIGLTQGQRQGAAAQYQQDQKGLQACLGRERDRAQADQDEALARARAALRAQQAARGGRARERVYAQSVDSFKGSGGACMQAEQMIREFVK